MAVDVDYYAVLDVARNADKEAIEAAVKKSMREWRKRTEAADLAFRQEAEVKVKQIEQARTTLLDDAKRSAYDKELAGGVKEQTVPTASTAGTAEGWLQQAEGFLAVGDYPSAAYAAREATHMDDPNARAWWVRSRANAGLKLWQDALFEAKKAVQLADANADYHFNLGLVQEEMGQWNEAVNSFRRAGTCDPNNPMYELAVGGVYASTNKLEQALPIIEAVYAKYPQDSNANYYLGTVLIDLAEKIPKKKEADTYWVTSQDEIDNMRKYANRAKSLNVVDDDVRKAADQMLGYLDRMEQKAFRPPWTLISGAGSIAMESGCIGGGLIMAIALGLYLLPVILIFSSFAVMGDNAGGGFVMLLIGAGLAYIWYRISWIPRWKHNRRDLK